MALDRIVARKREEMYGRRARGGALEAGSLAPSTRSLERALRAGRASFVLEHKRASPSRGNIRPGSDAAEIARGYAEVADAISVLADEAFFGGSLADVAAVRAAVDLPILCKDVVVDPIQVADARRSGADAVLLMLSVLDDAAYAACAEAAARLGMDAVVEVRDRGELARAVEVGARIVGINNRDLATMRVDLGTTEGLAPLVPRDRVVLSESGIAGRADLRRIEGLVDGFLVGSALMESPDPARAARAFVRGRVKVCGIGTAEGAALAAESGATYGGLNFAAESPRRVSYEVAEALARDARLDWVGVFVNEAPAVIARVVRRLGLAAVQLHGEETPEEMHTLRERLAGGCEVWKAHRVRTALPEIEDGGADRTLLDAFAPGALGGTGKRFDWSLLEGRDLGSVVLAGGIDAGSAARAEKTGAFALDVCSGVEERPGVQSAEKLSGLFGALAVDGRRVPC